MQGSPKVRPTWCWRTIFEQYTQIAFESHHGVEIDRDVDTVFHFDLESSERVLLPLAEMVPADLRKDGALGEETRRLW